MSFVNTVELIGDEALTASIIDKSVAEIVDSEADYVGAYAFYKCTLLRMAKFKKAGRVDELAFYGCESLITADFSAKSSFYVMAFCGCASLTALVLRGGTVSGLYRTDCFANTPIDAGVGYIYVPAAVVDSYKSATNWSVYAAQFRALEDYTVDGTIEGDLDESKVAT